MSNIAKGIGRRRIKIEATQPLPSLEDRRKIDRRYLDIREKVRREGIELDFVPYKISW